MANDAKFNFYLNRQGPRGQKGEKGDPGFSPSITVNTDTADEYTLLIQNEYDSFVTDNIRPTYDDRGGTYVRVDRSNNVQYFGSADIATTANYGEVKLAQASDLASTVDVGNSNVITVELLKTWFDGQLADNLVTTTNNVTIQGQKIFATPTRFMDTVRIGNRLMVTQEDTGTITFDSNETSTLIGTDATFKKDVRVYGGAGIDGNLHVSGATSLYGDTSIIAPLYAESGITVQTGGVKIQGGDLDANGRNTITKNLMLSPGPLKTVKGFSGFLYADTSAILPGEYITVGDERLPLRLVGTKVLANGKDVATADTVDAIQSDLNIAKQDIIEAQGDIDNLQMNKQNKLTAGSGITIDADNVISATGGVVDIPIASSTTLGGIKVGENLTISEDGTLSATGGGTGDVSAAGNNTFTGENTFNGAVNLNGISTAENLTVTGNLTSNGEINAVSIKTTGLRSDDIQTTTNKKYLTEADVDNQTIQVVGGKLHANLDELGNEVNTLSGEVAGLSGDVTTLSGKVTAVEGKTTDLESALANKQNKLTAGEGIAIDQSTNTISSTTPITYLTRAEYDALGTKDANTMYVITDEEGGGGTPSDVPILDVPVNNCVLAMPTAPTFDGTNVKVYAGTKVAIPNGLNADGTCKSNIVTLTSDATINQSTFNGDVTLMLKSDGTIDQTAYSYFEVDDISTITTLTAYCWYYDRKTNNHYLASSTGAKQGPYQRIKIGSYNQAEAATTKYFKTYKPIALEKLDITGSCMPDYSAGKDISPATIHTATVDGYVFAQASSRSGGNGGHIDIYDKNGTLIKTWNYVGAEATPTYGYSAFMCPIPKGYSYKVYGGVDIVIQFYPAKGTEV